jgi:hypothetical protein
MHESPGIRFVTFTTLVFVVLLTVALAVGSVVLVLYLMSPSGGAPFQPADSIYTQKGTFRTLIGQTGQVNFPFPYQSPPNVTLSGKTNTTTVTECTTTGFKWTNIGKEPDSDNGDVDWVAKGIKAQPGK